MRRRTALLTAAVVALSSGAAGATGVTRSPERQTNVAAAASAPADSHVRRAPVSARARAALGSAGELRGMALNEIGVSAILDATIADLPRLKSNGITSVMAYIYLHMDRIDSTEVTTGTNTPTDQELSILATAARANGLDLHFMPVITDPGHNPRGVYIPSDINKFFASYTKILNHYADLAQANGVTLLYVGSENDAITKYEAQWRALIASVRKHYKGALSYMSIGYRGLQAKFWNALDLMALSAYYSLGDEKVVTYDRVRSAWMKDHLPYLAKLGRQLRMPIIIGEVGYRSETGGYTAPAFQNGGLPAPQAQADAYAGLLDSLATSPYVYGVSWWRWHSTVPSVGPTDTGYSPANKPAECVIARRWATDPLVQQRAALPTCDLSTVDSLTNPLSATVRGLTGP